MILPDDVSVRYENLPTTVQSFIRENPDMSFTVVVNARCSREANMEAYRHELQHLDHEDLDSEAPADQIEAEAHK